MGYLREYTVFIASPRLISFGGRDDMGLGTLDFHTKMSTLTKYDRQNRPNDSDDGHESSGP